MCVGGGDFYWVPGNLQTGKSPYWHAETAQCYNPYTNHVTFDAYPLIKDTPEIVVEYEIDFTTYYALVKFINEHTDEMYRNTPFEHLVDQQVDIIEGRA